MDTVGRNDPCPCGSGKKYKKCCLNKSYLQRKQAKVLSKDSSAGNTAAKITQLSQEKGVANLFQKFVVPTVSESTETKSLKGKITVGDPKKQDDSSN